MIRVDPINIGILMVLVFAIGLAVGEEHTARKYSQCTTDTECVEMFGGDGYGE